MMSPAVCRSPVIHPPNPENQFAGLSHFNHSGKLGFQSAWECVFQNSSFTFLACSMSCWI